MLRMLMDKVDYIQEQVGNGEEGDGNFEKEPKRNARKKTHCNRNEE